MSIFQSTCHIRGMTLTTAYFFNFRYISIHMPHTWHDGANYAKRNFCSIISIHMPHTWHDAFVVVKAVVIVQISIHMPHTWHDIFDAAKVNGRLAISIHMPHTWHDVLNEIPDFGEQLFQSTCHIRGMTKYGKDVSDEDEISIHMPHTWHDRIFWARAQRKRHFNPHATYVA